MCLGNKQEDCCGRRVGDVDTNALFSGQSSAATCLSVHSPVGPILMSFCDTCLDQPCYRKEVNGPWQPLGGGCLWQRAYFLAGTVVLGGACIFFPSRKPLALMPAVILHHTIISMSFLWRCRAVHNGNAF